MSGRSDLLSFMCVGGRKDIVRMATVKYVFITRATSDFGIVGSLASDLSRATTFRLTPADMDLEHAVRRSHVLIYVASPLAVKEGRASLAYQIARQYRIPVCAFWIAGGSWADVALPGMRAVPYVDARADYRRAVRNLIDWLERRDRWRRWGFWRVLFFVGVFVLLGVLLAWLILHR